MCVEVAFLQSSTKSTQVEQFWRVPEWLVIIKEDRSFYSNTQESRIHRRGLATHTILTYNTVNDFLNYKSE